MGSVMHSCTQIRELTRGLGLYSVKRQFMTQDYLLSLSKLWAVWKQENPGFPLPGG